MSQDTDKTAQPQIQNAKRVPNEQVGFYFSGYVRITDPQTGEVLAQTRVD